MVLGDAMLNCACTWTHSSSPQHTSKELEQAWVCSSIMAVPEINACQGSLAHRRRYRRSAVLPEASSVHSRRIRPYQKDGHKRCPVHAQKMVPHIPATMQLHMAMSQPERPIQKYSTDDPATMLSPYFRKTCSARPR